VLTAPSAAQEVLSVFSLVEETEPFLWFAEPEGG